MRKLILEEFTKSKKWDKSLSLIFFLLLLSLLHWICPKKVLQRWGQIFITSKHTKKHTMMISTVPSLSRTCVLPNHDEKKVTQRSSTITQQTVFPCYVHHFPAFRERRLYSLESWIFEYSAYSNTARKTRRENRAAGGSLYLYCGANKTSKKLVELSLRL